MKLVGQAMRPKKSSPTLEFYGWLLLPVGLFIIVSGSLVLLVAVGEAEHAYPRASYGPNTWGTILERMVSHPDAVDFTILGAVLILFGMLALTVLPLGIWSAKRKRRLARMKEPFLGEGVTGAREKWAKLTGSEPGGEGVTMEDTDRRSRSEGFDDSSRSRVTGEPAEGN
jgi:hypothetical protein